MITKNKVKDFAELLNFSVKECGRNIMLTANFEYSDGYKPGTVPISNKEAFAFLQGFYNAKYEQINSL